MFALQRMLRGLRSLRSARFGSGSVAVMTPGVARFEPAGTLPSRPGAGWSLYAGVPVGSRTGCASVPPASGPVIVT